MAAVAGWTITTVPLLVDGTLSAGDGGKRILIFNTSKCGANGNSPAGNLCVNSVVAAGSWNIDLSIFRATVSPALFTSNFGTNPAADTAAMQAALATGRHVYIPGNFTATGPMTCSTNGQEVEGAGRRTTNITVPSTFPTSAQGVFIDTVSEPGCVFHDFSATFAEPDTVGGQPISASSAIKFPPLIYAEGMTRVRVSRLGCYVAWVCFDFKGNAGGAVFDDVESSALFISYDIDGAQDTIRIFKPHDFLFAMTANQQALVNANHKAFRVGRADDLQIVGGLAITGLIFDFHAGNDGNGTCSSTSITDFSFDTFQSGIKMSCGNVEISGGYFGSAKYDPQMVNMTGGHLTISHPRFISHGGIEASSSTSFMLVNGSGQNTAPSLTAGAVTCAAYSYCGFPVLDINNAPFVSNIDAPMLILYAGQVILDHNQFRQAWNAAQGAPGTFTSLSYSKFYVAKASGTGALSAGLIAQGNWAVRPPAGATGTLIGATSSSDDENSRWSGNAAPGWGIVDPTTGAGASGAFLGSYGPN